MPVLSVVLLDWLWLLLPVAAASGWYVADHRKRDGKRSDARAGLRNHYFKGVNYLLNEQPDKALEVFIQMLEVDRETVEAHLALGNLYRRQGEVDRAIRIHHNLIEGSTLSDEERSEARLELGQDYLSAGLLDRAEAIFQSLAEHEAHRVQALRQLIEIYEQEQDWDRAIECARRLQDLTGNQLAPIIAHYFCQKAERIAAEADWGRVSAALKQALDLHPACVRARLLEGDMRRAQGEHRLAIEAYLGVEGQDPNYLPEILSKLRECYDALGRRDDLCVYLEHVIHAHDSIAATLALADLLREREGFGAAARFVAEQLKRKVSIRGLDYLLDLELRSRGVEAPEYLAIQKALTEELLEDRLSYQCEHCGFLAKSLHWRCPSCKHWNTVKPIQGVGGGD